jgi:hypothetical protein
VYGNIADKGVFWKGFFEQLGRKMRGGMKNGE